MSDANVTKRLMLDMDPGVDDAIALLLAAVTPEVEVVGIGTSCGNIGEVQSALNAARILDTVGQLGDIPLYVGASEPLSNWPQGGKPDAEAIHGPGGLGLGAGPDIYMDHLSEVSAVDAIVQAYQQPSDVTLVVTGPLTNVALALRQSPQIAANIPRIVFMGGAFGVPGNIAPWGEFNVWMDPVAAAEVFASVVPMTVVGLDVALQCPLTKQGIKDRLDPMNSTIGGFVDSITDHYMDFYLRAESFHGCYLHDPLAMAVAIWPDVVETEAYHVQVVTDRTSPTYGMTATDRRARQDRMEPEKDIALKVDAGRVLESVFSTLA